VDRLRHALTIAAVCGLAAEARADHDHAAGHAHGEDDGAGLSLSFGVLAARYRTTLYAGDYEGTRVGAAWSRGRFTLGAAITGYRLTRNGRTDYGPGDATGSADVELVGGPRGAIGLAVALSAPTGSARRGLGMGHPMMMSSLWGRWSLRRVLVDAAIGYGRVLGDTSAHAAHGGPWPLVDPMNASELTLGGAIAVALSPQLRVGVASACAVPVPRGDGATSRATAALRATLHTGRVVTDIEIGAGLLGDPYAFRGLVSAAVRLD
jgi:hypothetical protein